MLFILWKRHAIFPALLPEVRCHMYSGSLRGLVAPHFSYLLNPFEVVAHFSVPHTVWRLSGELIQPFVNFLKWLSQDCGRFQTMLVK